jgi:hypothetical protein
VPIAVERLIRLLDDADGVDEWIATETRIRRVVRRPRARTSGDEVLLGAVVFRDSERGRGGDAFWLDGESGDDGQARALIAQAGERAALAPGPAWALSAPAAPARVMVADRDISDDPGGAADAALAQLRAANGRLGAVRRERVDVESRSHRAENSRGFASQYESTSIDFEASVGALSGPGRELSETLRGRVRAGAQLALHRRVAEAARRASDRGQARPLEPGRCDLLLRAAAIAPLAELDPSGPAGFGWFAPLIAHASGSWVRLGISRHRPGQAVFAPPPGSATSALALERGPTRGVRAQGDPLTLSSDGTIPFAPLSAPFGDQGEPVRRFDLVRAGVAAGLALDHREAGLARVTPNGGVRNLVVAPGLTPAARLAEPGVTRLVEVESLAWIDVDPRTGSLTAGIQLARLGARSLPASGGILVDNVFALLARARLSAEVATIGWYRGPIAMRIDDVDLIGP